MNSKTYRRETQQFVAHHLSQHSVLISEAAAVEHKPHSRKNALNSFMKASS
jgi:hypothetical protein